MKPRHHNGGRLRAALVCLLLPLLGALPALWADSQPPLRVVVWGEEREGASLRGINDLLTSFQDRHPDIRVNLTHEPWSQATIRLRYWCHSHRQYAPDLTLLPDVWLGDYAAELLALDEGLKPKDTDGFVPAVLDRCRVKGKLVGVPWLVRSRALYYRPDLLEAAKLKPPRTLADLKAAALALADPPNRYGLGLPAEAGGGALEAFLDLLHAQGTKSADPEGTPDLASEEAEATVAYWVELRRSGALQPEGLSWSEEDLQTAFARGRLGMMIAGPELLVRIRAEAPELQVGTAPVPAEHDPALPISADVLVALSSTRQSAQAVEFMRFMASAEAQRGMSLLGGLPTCRKHYESVRDDRDVRPFVLGLERAWGLPMHGLGQTQRIVERALMLALSGRMRPSEALKAATKEVSEETF